MAVAAAEGGPVLRVLVDADACPVKQEVYRVAERHGAEVLVVANTPVAVPRADWIRRILVPQGPDAADDWIASEARPGDVVVTADVPLADRALKAGAGALAPDGRAFSEAAIGMALAHRDLMAHLRETGTVTGGPKPMGQKERSRFLQALDLALRRARQGRAG